jgi:hypothetical protein
LERKIGAAAKLEGFPPCALGEKSLGQGHARFAPDQAAAPFCQRAASSCPISSKC